MFRSLLTNWLAARMTPELQARLREAAVDSVREAVAGASEANAEYESARQARPVACGMIFAAPQEYGCLTDLMTGVQITRGGGFKYTDGTLAKKRVVIVEAGIGAEKAAAATEALIQAFRPERIISAGFSGALVGSLTRNRVVWPKTIVDQQSGETLDLWQKLLPNAGDADDSADSDNSADGAAAQGGKGTAQTDANGSKNAQGSTDAFERRFAVGTLLTAERVVESPGEKKRLANQFGATLVDMEGFAVGKICARAEVPFLSIRVILDEVGETMPRDLKNLADAAQANPARLLGAFFGAVTNRPSSLLDMYKLKENALVAADTLAKALADILAE